MSFCPLKYRIVKNSIEMGLKFLVSSKLPPTPPMEEEVEKVPASETGMTKLGASKRKRTSSGDAERGKLVLEVVEPAVEEPEEKVSQIFAHVNLQLHIHRIT